MPDQTGVYRNGQQVPYEELRATLRQILGEKSSNYWTGPDLANMFRRKGYVFSTERVRIILAKELARLISELGLHTGVRVGAGSWDIVVSRVYDY